MVVRYWIILVVLTVFGYADEARDFEVCFVKECVTTAAFLLQSMNITAKPCEDFYEYACGNYGYEFPLNINMPVRSTLAVRQEEFLAEIKVLLDAQKNLVESDSMHKAKDFYNTCMNSTETDELQSIISFVQESLGGLPMVDEDWDEEHFSWQEMLTYLITRGFQNTGLFDITMKSKPDDDEIQFKVRYAPSALELIFDNGNLNGEKVENGENGEKAESGENGEKDVDDGSEGNGDDDVDGRKIISHGLQSVLKNLGTESANFANETMDVVDLMYSYMKLPTYSRPISIQTIRSLEDEIPEFNWTRTLQKLTKSELTPETVVHVEGIAWLRSVIQLAEEADSRLMANYLITNALASLYVNNELSVATSEFVRATFAVECNKQIPYDITKLNSIFCIEYASQISNAVKAAHFKKYISSTEESSVLQMIHEIINNFTQTTRQQESLKAISEIIIRLLEDTSIVVGVDDNYRKNFQVDNQYASLFSHRTSHLANTLSLQTFKRNQQLVHHGYLSTIGLQQPDVTCVTNANGIEQIIIPLSLLRGIAFASERTVAFNYGTLGYKIMEGLLNCFSHFQEYNDEKLAVDNEIQPSKTQFHPDVVKLEEFEKWPKWADKKLEKLVDIEHQALKQAHNSYEHVVDDNLVLPGVDATPRQLFWLGYASLHCQAYRERYTRHLKYFTGDINKLSVLTVIHQFREFAEDFGCPKNFAIGH